MLFKNENQDVKVRIGSLSRFHWLTIRTGDVVDLEERLGLRLGLKKVELITQKNETAQDSAEPNEPNEPNETPVETHVSETNSQKVETKLLKENFLEELEKINGIGKKTAKDIIKVFPTKQLLKKAIHENAEIPLRDDIEKKLRSIYGGPNN